MISCLCVALFCSFLNVFLITSFAYCLCIFCSILILIIRNLFLNCSSPFMVEKHFFSSFGWAFFVSVNVLISCTFSIDPRFRSAPCKVEFWWRNFREPWANLLSQTYTLARRSYSQISSLWCCLFVVQVCFFSLLVVVVSLLVFNQNFCRYFAVKGKDFCSLFFSVSEWRELHFIALKMVKITWF